MKEILVGMAEYNRSVNQKLVGILRGVDAAILKKDQGAFYKSLLGILEHITASEIILIRRFSGFFSYHCLSGHRFITGDMDAIKATFHDNPSSIYSALAETDELMVLFAHELKVSNLSERVSYKTFSGDTIERTYWNLIVHVFNHSTHHRGEISALLDQNGISNDYSGFNLYTK